MCDFDGACAWATATIAVERAPSAPIAARDTAATAVDTPVTIAVLANDTDPDGDLDPDSLAVGTAPAHGAATVNVAEATITYTPTGGYSGADRFTYSICDGGGRCTLGRVIVDVRPAEPTTVTDDQAWTVRDTPATVHVLDNDGDADPATLEIVAAPSFGTAVVEGTTIRYTPAAGFVGDDDFIYRVCVTGGGCAEAAVSLTVLRENHAPRLAADAGISTAGQAVIIDVLANDDGGDDPVDPDTLAIATLPGHGVVSVNDDHTLTYTPEPGYVGTDHFRYSVCDTLGSCGEANVNLRVE